MITKSRTAKLAIGFVGAVTAISFAMTPIIASAATIAELQAMIASLSVQLAALSGGTASTGAGYTFNTNLTVGSRGTDVMNLQKTLNMSADTKLAGTGAGSPGMETSYFGGLTKQAVMKFQAKYGISPVAGYVGPLTRGKLNTMGGVVVTPPVVPPVVTPGLPQGGALTVTAGTQPANSLAPQSASRVPFTTFTLTAGANDVTVNSITVERVGLANDAVFSGIVLLKSDGMQIGVAKTLNSSSQVTVGEPWVIKAGTSQTLTVAGNMAASLSSYSGQVTGLNVVAVNTSASVSGSLPITGANHTINSTLSLGTATLALSSYDPNSAQTKEIGVTNYKFAGIRVTTGSVEDVKLWSVRWNQSGTASANDIANVKIYVAGTAYDGVVSADGKYYSAVFPDGILVKKGSSEDIYIQGDLVGTNSAARTVQFDLYKNTDLYLSGTTYGYGIIATASANCNATASTATTASEFINSSTTCASSGTIGSPFFSASTITVAAGSVTSISKANSIPAGNVAVNVSNQVLGGFTTDIKGEPISVQEMIFAIATTGTWTSSGVLTNVSIVDPNGLIVATADQPTNAAATLTFTDTVTFPVGVTTYTIKGKVPTGAPQGGTIILSSTPSSQWTTVRGQVTGDTISLSSNGAFTMNTMTVRAAALAISASTQPTARTVIAGAQGFEYARITLDAGGSGENVRFGSIPLRLNGGSQSFAIEESKLTSCQLFDTASPTMALNTGSNVANPSTSVATTTTAPFAVTFTLDQQYSVPAGTVKTLSLKCNLSSTADTASQVQWGVLAGATMSVTGASGSDVTEVITTGNGQVMTVATGGSYTVTNDSSLLYATAQAGTAGVTLAKFRFTAGANEDVDLKQIALLLGNSSASSTPADLVGQSVTIWNGATQIGTANFGGSAARHATSTQLSPVPRVLAGESIVLTIKGDLSAQGINEGTPGALLAVSYNGGNSGINGNYAIGVSSQTTIAGGTTSEVTSNGLRIFRTLPSIAVTSTGGTLGAGTDLYKFVVTNPNSRDVVFHKFSMSIATSGGATNGFILYGDGIAFNTSTSTTASETFIELVSTQTSQAQIVPANSSKTYILKATTAVDTASVSESINLALLADTSYVADINTLMATVVQVELGAGATDNVIWSPFSTTTPVATADTQSNLDWTNGYGMPGFPSNADFPVQVWTRAN